MDPVKRILVTEYHHVDNGGITFTFGVEFEKTNPSERIAFIEIDTSYFGYTALSSKLAGEDLTPDVLRSIGKAFCKAADEIDKLQMLDTLVE